MDTADTPAIRLFDYLSGYGKQRPDRLHQLIAYNNWTFIASYEIARRMHAVLNLVDDETVAAIATGALDVRSIAQAVLWAQEIEGQKHE